MRQVNALLQLFLDPSNFAFNLLKSLLRGQLQFLQSLRISLFDLLADPEALNQIEGDEAHGQNEQQGDANALDVADHFGDRAAERVAEAAQDQRPRSATPQREQQKAHDRHSSHSVEDARSHPQPEDIFDDEDGERAVFINELDDARSSHLVEAKSAHASFKTATDAVENAITGSAADCSCDEHFGETVIAENSIHSQHARNQKRRISLPHREKEDGVEAVLAHQVEKEVVLHHAQQRMVSQREEDERVGNVQPC